MVVKQYGQEVPKSAWRELGGVPTLPQWGPVPPSLRLGVELCRDPSPDAGKPRWLSVLELGTRVVQPPAALPGTVTGRPRFPPPHSRLGVGGSALPNIF